MAGLIITNESIATKRQQHSPKMKGHIMQHPKSDEYAHYYAAYVDQVEDFDILATLVRQRDEVCHLFQNLTDEQLQGSYATGKWTMKEVLGHIIDTERVFAFRAFTFARGDAGPLPGMDQDSYNTYSRFVEMERGELLERYRSIRQETLLLCKDFTESDMDRRGIASECEFTVRALTFIIAGHEKHHLNVLHEKYLG